MKKLVFLFALPLSAGTIDQCLDPNYYLVDFSIAEWVYLPGLGEWLPTFPILEGSGEQGSQCGPQCHIDQLPPVLPIVPPPTAPDVPLPSDVPEPSLIGPLLLSFIYLFRKKLS